jgi:hypothetical protein
VLRVVDEVLVREVMVILCEVKKVLGVYEVKGVLGVVYEVNEVLGVVDEVSEVIVVLYEVNEVLNVVYEVKGKRKL